MIFKNLFKKKCKHIFKTEIIEYLYSKSHMWNAGCSIDIDYYDIYAHHQICLICEQNKIITKGELVHSPKTKPI